MIRTCLFRPRILPEREGVLQEIVPPPPWAHGIDIKHATRLALVPAHPARGHRSGAAAADRRMRAATSRGWVRYALQEALEKQQNRRGGAA